MTTPFFCLIFEVVQEGPTSQGLHGRSSPGSSPMGLVLDTMRRWEWLHRRRGKLGRCGLSFGGGVRGGRSGKRGGSGRESKSSREIGMWAR